MTRPCLPVAPAMSNRGSPTFGHNSGNDLRAVRLPMTPQRKAQLVAAIDTWVSGRRQGPVLSAEQLRNMEPFQRMLALRGSMVDNLSSFYAENPKADVAPGVLTILTTFADDERFGGSTLSIARIGKLFHRSDRAIEGAIKRLRIGGQISVVRRPGFSSIYVPRVAVVLANGDLQLTYLADALAPHQPVRLRGRRRYSRDGAAETSTPNGDLDTPEGNRGDCRDGSTSKC